MTPDFVKAIDPIVELMIDVKEQIEKNNFPAPELIRNRFIQRIDASEKMVDKRPQEWELASYALVAWIDEMLASQLPWNGASYWNQNKLQVKYFRNMLARERFFLKAKEAENLPKKDALEVYFMCVILGFKGVYDGAPGLESPRDVGIPDEMADWIRRTRDWIKLSPMKVNEPRQVGIEHDAGPMNGKYQLLGMFMTFVVTSLLAGLVVFIWAHKKPSAEEGTELSRAIVPSAVDESRIDQEPVFRTKPPLAKLFEASSQI